MATVVQHNKYQRLKKQVSLDGGVTWNDVMPLEYMTGELLEVNSRDCGYSVVYQWTSQTIEGSVVSVEEISYNGGTVWEATGKVKVNGRPIDMREAIVDFGEPLEDYLDGLAANVQDYIDSVEENNSGSDNNDNTGDGDPEPEQDSDDNSYLSVYLYQKWVKHSGQTNFVPKWPIEYSIEGDGGETTTRMDHDPECGYTPPYDPTYRWIEDGYVCIEETVEITTLYRWADSGRYVCVNGDKYALLIRQKSEDNGITWTNVSPVEYRRGELIETDSTDCKNLIDVDYYFESAGEYTLALDRGGVVEDVWVDGNNLDFSGQNIMYTASAQGRHHVNFSLSGNQVPSYMFASNTKLDTVNIPSKFTNIGYYAFRGCTYLRDLYLDGVQTINIGAFEDCINLVRVEFPETLTSIDDEAFSRCQSLEELTFNGDFPPIISENTFYNCPLVQINVTQNAYNYFINDQIWSQYASIISVMD